MTRTAPRPSAFTIIELLVVIAIIAILAGLLLPVLSTAKETARAADCRANLKSLAVAVDMYALTWDDFYPPSWVVYPDGVSGMGWCGLYYQAGGSFCDAERGPLWPYLKDKRIAMCKSFTPVAVKYAGSGEISGYGINNQYVAGNGAVAGMPGYAQPARRCDIRSASNTILFGDCARWKGSPVVLTEELFIYPLYKYGTTTKNYASFHFRHSGTANVAFCDSHVDSVSPTQLDPAGDGTCGWMANDLMDRQ